MKSSLLLLISILFLDIFHGCTNHKTKNSVVQQIATTKTKQVNFQAQRYGVTVVLERHQKVDSVFMGTWGTEVPTFWALKSDGNMIASDKYFLLASNDTTAMVYGEAVLDVSIKRNQAFDGMSFDQHLVPDYFNIAFSNFRTKFSPSPNHPFYLRIDTWNEKDSLATGRASGMMFENSGDSIWVKECYFKAKIEPFPDAD